MRNPTRRQRLEHLLAEIGQTPEDDLPLGRHVSRREAIVKAAVEEADSFIMDFSDGSVEETNFLTTEVALALMAKVLHPLRAALLRKDLEEASARTSKA